MLKVGVPRFTRVPQLLVYNRNKYGSGITLMLSRIFCHLGNMFDLTFERNVVII